MVGLRWKAVVPIGIVFGVLIGGMWVFNIFFLTRILETQLTKVSGQQVDIERARLSVFPLGFEIHNIGFVDVKDGMQQRISIGDISASVSMDALLKKKIHIPLINMTDIAHSKQPIVVNDTGSTPAAAEHKKTPDSDTKKGSKKKNNAFSKLGSHFDVGELIQLPESTIEKEGQKIREEINALEAKWQGDVFEEFQKKHQETLEKKYEALSEKAEEIKSLEDAKDLLDSFNGLSAEVKRVGADAKTLQAEFNVDMKTIRTQVNRLKHAGKSDLDKVKSVASVGGGDYGKISDIFFKDALKHWISRGKSVVNYVQKRRPKKQAKEDKREKGKTVVFITKNTRPSFWIKRVQISASEHAKTPIMGHITDISSQPSLVLNPIRINLTAHNVLQSTDAARVQATLDYRYATGNISGDGAYTDYFLEDLELARDGNAYMGVDSLKVDSNVDFEVENDMLNIDVATLLHHPKYKVKNVKPGDLSLPSVFLTGLKDLKHATVDVSIDGQWQAPGLKVNSSLDKVFSSALSQIMQQQKEQALEEARAKIRRELKVLEDELGLSLDGLEGSVLSKLGGIDDKNKELEAGAGEKKAGLTDFKKQLENRVRKEIEDSAKKELKKLEEQFKNLF